MGGGCRAVKWRQTGLSRTVVKQWGLQVPERPGPGGRWEDLGCTTTTNLMFALSGRRQEKQKYCLRELDNQGRCSLTMAHNSRGETSSSSFKNMGVKSLLAKSITWASSASCPRLCRTILWVTVGQGKQGHPMSAELPYQAAGHGIARQEHGMATQQASQHGALDIMCPVTATRKGKGQDSRQKVNGH